MYKVYDANDNEVVNFVNRGAVSKGCCASKNELQMDLPPNAPESEKACLLMTAYYLAWI